jgi:hypothetical protein
LTIGKRGIPAWTLQVKHYTVSRLLAKIPPLGGDDDS